MLATQDDARCRALVGRLARNGTAQVPTLVAARGYAYMRELAAGGDPRLRYLDPEIEGFWTPSSNPFTSRFPEERWLSAQAQYRRLVELVPLMAAAGVPILAGSDTPNPWVIPGFGLHDELELLVQAGLTPLQALQAATVNPARFLGRTDELGTVGIGKLADLLVLEANPLEDITATRRIRAVVADGRLYRRAELDGLLDALAAQQAR
jgi:imidazolonepropionase-like amidohydrolase